jgi:Cdc6-like AAA superfamily ATPase
VEPKQSNSIKGIDCWFSDICPKTGQYCIICTNRGLNYLLAKHYIPKTLIPRNYLMQKLEDLDLRGPAAEALYYAENVWDLANQGKGMYCWSEQTGTGKTSVSIIALMRYLFQSVTRDPYKVENRRALYLNTTEFLDKIRKSYISEDIELDQLLDELMNVETAPPILLLDDIGAEKSTPWVMERIYSILNFRSVNGLATIFTSNMSVDQLEKQLGSRIASRIRGSAKELKFPGKDHRRCDW